MWTRSKLSTKNLFSISQRTYFRQILPPSALKILEKYIQYSLNTLNPNTIESNKKICCAAFRGGSYRNSLKTIFLTHFLVIKAGWTLRIQVFLRIFALSATKLCLEICMHRDTEQAIKLVESKIFMLLFFAFWANAFWREHPRSDHHSRS